MQVLNDVKRLRFYGQKKYLWQYLNLYRTNCCQMSVDKFHRTAGAALISFKSHPSEQQRLLRNPVTTLLVPKYIFRNYCRNRMMEPIDSFFREEVFDPLYPVVFKKIFGCVTNESITKQFIFDVTGISVEEITFLNPQVEVARRNVVVLCKSSCGGRYLIEIQRARQDYIRRRILYDGAKFFSEPLNVDKEYFSKLKTIVIAISEDNFPLSGSSYVSHHKFVNTETLKCEIDGLKFIVLNLSKFNKNEVNQLENGIDAWCFYLKYAEQLNQNEFAAFENKYPHMKRAIDELRTLKLTGDEKDRYLLYFMAKKDTKAFPPNDSGTSAMQVMHQYKIKMAKNLLADGVSIDIICKNMGLEREELE